MSKWKASIVVVLAGVLSLLIADPASADSPVATHGNDWAQIRAGAVYGEPNRRIMVCDGEADGKHVWAQYHLVSAGGYSSYEKVYDLDGPNNNSCGIDDYSGWNVWARAVRVCEYEGGCGKWVYIPEARSTAGNNKSTS